MVESLCPVVLCRCSCPIAHSRDLVDPLAVHTWDHEGGRPLLPLVPQRDLSDPFSPYDCVVMRTSESNTQIEMFYLSCCFFFLAQIASVVMIVTNTTTIITVVSTPPLIAAIIVLLLLRVVESVDRIFLFWHSSSTSADTATVQDPSTLRSTCCMVMAAPSAVHCSMCEIS